MAFPTLNVTPGSGVTINTLPGAGQAAMVNSLPVVVASDQSVIHMDGAAAQDAAVSGNPLYVGVEARATNKAAVASGDAVGAIGTLVGAQIVYPWSIPEMTWSYAAASGGIVNTTTAVTIKAAGAAGVCNYLKTLHIGHDVLGTATEFAVRDGAGGTVLFRMKLPVGVTEGQTIKFEPPLRGTAATLMEVVTLTGTTTGGVFVNAQGFVAP